MGNIIGGDSMNNPINFMQFQAEATKSAYHRGDVGNLGKKEAKIEDPTDQMEGVKSFRRLDNGLTITHFEDGSSQLKANNGVIRDDYKGNRTITLPNGLRIEDKDGSGPMAFDPSTGNYLSASSRYDPADGHTYYDFKDSQGNRYEISADTLSFRVENPSETLTQQVHSDGSMDIRTKTLSRDPVSGKFIQDENRIHIRANGEVIEKRSTLSDVAISNQGIHFTAQGDLNVGIKFPYPPPQHLFGKCVKPDMPPITQEPTMPPPNSTPMPGPQFPPHHYPANYGFPSYPGWAPSYPGGYPIPSFPGDPYQGFPWMGFPYPGAPPIPKPGPEPGAPPPVQDPFAPVMTPSGLIRKKEPDGSLFISMPNGIVLNQMPDGKAQAFDVRLEGKVLPVVVQDVENPGYGPEKRYNFQDAEGNLITLYSQTLDFAVASRDGNILETVSPNGDIMMHVRTYPIGQDGQPTPKNHKILVTGDGKVYTFGEQGIQVNNKNIVFAENGQITNYKLPYEIPPHQGLMPYFPPMGFPMPGAPIPVSDPLKPAFYTGPDGMPKMGPHPTVADKEPVYPPGYKKPTVGSTRIETTGRGTERIKSGIGQKDKKGPNAIKTDNTMDPGKIDDVKILETSGEKPIKPGIWQSIKNFFKGESAKANSPKCDYCSGNNWCSPYPNGYYYYQNTQPNRWQELGWGAMLGLQMGTSILMASMMLYPMMCYPVGIYYNPFGIYGLYGIW